MSLREAAESRGFSVEDVYRACRMVLSALLTSAMPRVFERILGEAGFVDAFEVVKEATREALQHLYGKAGGSGGLDALEANREAAEKVLEMLTEILHDVSGVEAEVRVGGDRVEVTLRGCPETGGEMVRRAVYMGIVAGLLEALGGGPVRPARDEAHAEKAARLARGGWVVYHRGGDGTHHIVALRVG